MKKPSPKNISLFKSIDTITTKLLMLVLFVTIIPLVVVGNYSSNIINNNVEKSVQRELMTASKLFDEKINNKTNIPKENLNKIANSIKDITGLDIYIQPNTFKNSCTEKIEKYQTWICKPLKNLSSAKTDIVYFSIPDNTYVNSFYKNISLISIISVISLFIAIGIAALFARTITTPILKLVQAAKQIASGNLNQKVKIKGNDEIAQLSTAFNQMAKDIKKQEQLKDNFVATLTHDLKVPMLAENKTISYMLKEAYGSITEEQKEVLELIKSTNNSSLEMISTLLEVYRFDEGNIQLNKTFFNIVELARNSIEQVYSLAQEKEIKIELKSNNDKIFIKADEREIKRVIHNLISNAIINNAQNGYICCNIDLEKEEIIYNPRLNQNEYTTLQKPVIISNSAIVSIEDNGVGIIKEDMPQLFKRFSLSKGRKPAGTGLGLYYSYQVVKEHNGFIWAESTENKGSTFKFILPVN
ncbi:MAG: HAMP domain-containing sensor histidine kinase [Candidatus Gastranaerophilales bacterium]|nr:HAMP domain-containing sensor histidine kinase [Candidatus Gastranaerophilales bacterium]